MCLLSRVRPGRLPSSNNYLVGCYGKNPFEGKFFFFFKMKRSGDKLNFSEGERGGKSRKTLNFARADRDGVKWGWQACTTLTSCF